MYLDYTISSLNDKEFFFNRYDNTHILTGCLGAIAEIYKYIPELFDLTNPWNQSLNIKTKNNISVIKTLINQIYFY